MKKTFIKNLVSKKLVRSLSVELQRSNGENMMNSVLRDDNIIQASMIDVTKEKQLEQEEGILAGHLYYIDNGKVSKSTDHITIIPESQVAITREKGAVYWSNGPSSDELVEDYARNFNPKILSFVKK